jgi:hypothetical protein
MLEDGSNGRRPIPMILSTMGSRSSAVTAEMPISPVGPVTATVSPISDGVPSRSALKPRVTKVANDILE